MCTASGSVERRIRRAYGIAECCHFRVFAGSQVSLRLRETQVYLPGPAAHHARGESRPGVLFLQGHRYTSEQRVQAGRTTRVTTGAHYETRAQVAEQAGQTFHTLEQGGHELPVLPDATAPERLEGKQRMRQLLGGQHTRLHTALRAYEMHGRILTLLTERSRQSNGGIEVTTRAATGEKHHAHSAFLSELRAMLSRMPTAARQTSRLERPYDMKGSVTPVVGTIARLTAMCRSACTTIRLVTPTASRKPKRSRALRAMR